MAGLSHREIALQQLAHGQITAQQFRMLEARLFPPPPDPLADATIRETDGAVHRTPATSILITDDVLAAAGIGYVPEPKPGEPPKAGTDPFAVAPAEASSADIAAMAAALKTPTK